MNYKPLSTIKTSIGQQLQEKDAIGNLRREAKRSRFFRRTPYEVVTSLIDEKTLSPKVLDKWEEYKDKIFNMDFAAAIRYTANFYKKGLATYVPAGILN